MPPPLKLKISSKQEELLWNRKILNLDSSSGLIQAVIFYLIKSCGVYQGKDLRQLKTEHITFGEDATGKFVSIDFKSVVYRGKIVRHYDDPNNPRSLYKLLKTYMRYLANEGAFLVRPISSIKDYICYSPWPLGVSIIEHMVQTLMQEAGQGSRYGNISASLLALDILKSYGAGRHCLSTWIDFLGGAAHSYKIFNSRIPECSSINCKDLNTEAGLIMSHLLDPPYPSGPSTTSGDLKGNLEEIENLNSTCVTISETASEMSGHKQNTVSSQGPKPTSSKERLRLANRGNANLANVRRRSSMGSSKTPGGTSSSIYRKQVRIGRAKGNNSVQNGLAPCTSSSLSVSASSDTVATVAEIKTEPSTVESLPEVEIDIAGDNQHNASSPDEANQKDDQSAAPSESCIGKGKRAAATSENEEESVSASKIAKVEQHFQELEASLCSKLETFGDGVVQREDITVDSGGEAAEIANDDLRESNHNAESESDTSGLSGEKCEQDSSQHNVLAQKQEHLSLVTGLEEWLHTLKERVQTGANADMNGLLLQATSQLKAISDQMLTKRDDPNMRASHLHETTDGCGRKRVLTKKASPVEALLIKQPGTAQPSSPTSDFLPQQKKVFNISDQHASDGVDIDNCKEPGSTDSVESNYNDDFSSEDLSPPVLSPQRPNESADGQESFLFNNLPLGQEIQKQDANVEDNKSQPRNGKVNCKNNLISNNCESSVPDLVKVLGSANLKLQSLLSPSNSQTNQPSDAGTSTVSANRAKLSSLPGTSLSISDIDHGEKNSSQIESLKSAVVASQFASKNETENTICLQPKLPSERLNAPWPLLRSALEEASLSPSSIPKHSNPSVSRTSQSSVISTNTLPSSLSPQTPNSQPSVCSRSSDLIAHSGMYTFQSDHTAMEAVQSLTIVSGDKRSRVFTFPDLPLGKRPGAASRKTGQATDAGLACSLKSARSELCLGDYLPRGAVVPAQSIKVLTQEGNNGLEVVIKFDFSS
ncbi:hypothetical protein PoB_007634000 [Plakobranchus ocellatus]|uniref:DUF3504 domain-containing protein n=1 Tax=Plakobranchus ocellatus TaxID=259542 RepID=A0AAV4E0R7_9GAST|nr:hypothetical protein PoB_007634000 [Plakobranchus ocellatus]